MKHKFQTLIALGIAFIAAIADGDDSKVELAKFNGTWELLSAVTDGK